MAAPMVKRPNANPHTRRMGFVAVVNLPTNALGNSFLTKSQTQQLIAELQAALAQGN